MKSAEAAAKMPVTQFKYSRRVVLKTILSRSDGGLGLDGQIIVIGGWVKSSKELRKQPTMPTSVVAVDVGPPKDVTCDEVIQSRIPFLRSIFKVFGGSDHRIREKVEPPKPKLLPTPPPPQPFAVAILQVNDGSSVANLQVVVDSSVVPPAEIMATGTCILVEGVLRQPLIQGKSVIELKVEKILHIGTVDQNNYPLTKKRIPLDMLRDCSHFRPRTTTVASVTTIHNALVQASHTFFQNHGFLHVQVPIITVTDTEGFTEKFQVTTLLGKENPKNESTTGLEAMKASIKEKKKQVEELKRTDSNKEALVAAVQDLKKTNELALQLEARGKSTFGTLPESGEVNFSNDFFSCRSYLTVSGRLHLESYACGLGNVYSFGPRFRAERSESKRDLAEMWFVEAEMAFSQLEEAMNCADDFLKFLCKWVLENCIEDLGFVSKRIDKTVVDRLRSAISTPLEKITYREAVDKLKEVTEGKVDWGVTLTEEHHSYLANEIYKRPVIIYNHPKEVKPFYVRLNNDGKTVAAFDLVVPKAGTLIRGSQNEERLDMLNSRIKEPGLPKEEYEWYLELRKHGACKNSGFSLVFDLIVLYATGLHDVRDVIPFPRSCGKANN